MKIGSHYRVIKCDFFPILVGMEGEIVSSRIFNGEEVWKLSASNTGPKIPSKNNNAWKVWDTKHFHEHELMEIQK